MLFIPVFLFLDLLLSPFLWTRNVSKRAGVKGRPSLLPGAKAENLRCLFPPSLAWRTGDTSQTWWHILPTGTVNQNRVLPEARHSGAGVPIPRAGQGGTRTRARPVCSQDGVSLPDFVCGSCCLSVLVSLPFQRLVSCLMFCELLNIFEKKLISSPTHTGLLIPSADKAPSLLRALPVLFPLPGSFSLPIPHRSHGPLPHSFEFAPHHCLKEMDPDHTTPSLKFANCSLCLEILSASLCISFHFPTALASFYCGTDIY